MSLEHDPGDRTPWPVTVCASAFGVCVGIRLSDARLADDLLRHLPPESTVLPFSDAGRVYSIVAEPASALGESYGSLYVDGAPVVRRASIQAVLRAFESDLQLHVAEMAPGRVFVHAGVVGWQGSGILIPGRSFSGKTTLVAELVGAGAQYYSDEYAVLDPDGWVHPYSRPPAVRQVGQPGMPKRAIPVGPGGTGPLPVGLVVVTAFRAEAAWRPETLSPGQCVLALLNHAVAARRATAAVLATLERVATTAAALASGRGEASDVARLILAQATQGRLH